MATEVIFNPRARAYVQSKGSYNGDTVVSTVDVSYVHIEKPIIFQK